MPSPIAHAAIGYVAYRLWRKRLPSAANRNFFKLPSLLLLTTVLSLAPDIDAVVGLLMGDLGRFHNNLTNSLTFVLVLSTAIAGLAYLTRPSEVSAWFALGLVCVGAHIAMDYLTVGRGVMLFWPLSSNRYGAPLKLFYGLHWSDGLFSIRHLWTALTETVFALVVILPLRLLSSEK